MNAVHNAPAGHFATVAAGDVEIVSTSTDTLGRKQPRKRKPRTQSTTDAATLRALCAPLIASRYVGTSDVLIGPPAPACAVWCAPDASR